MDLIYTNEACTGCNKCVRACPVLTANVATEAGKVMVDSEKCIACGACFDACPHEAEIILMIRNVSLQIYRRERRFL